MKLFGINSAIFDIMYKLLIRYS